jgi:hypothetical protein
MDNKYKYKTSKLSDNIIYKDFTHKSVKIKEIYWSKYKNLIFVVFDDKSLENKKFLINSNIFKMITNKNKLDFDYLKSLSYDLLITKGFIISNINNEFVLVFKNKEREYCCFISISGKNTIGDIVFKGTKKISNELVIEKFLIINK